MLAKYVTTGLVGSLMLAGAAFAQQPSTADKADMKAGSTTSSSYQGDWRASKIAGLSVYNEKNEKIGSINDLLMDKSGAIKAAVIGVGGFLGMGEHLVAVSFDKVKFVDTPVPASTASTAPAGSSTTTGSTANPPSTTSSTSLSKPNPWYPDHAEFSATKDELQAMPEFKYSNE